MNELTLRTCGDRDAGALRRLAERDSALVPDGNVLAAEVGGELVAAIALESGRVIADPFTPTAQAVELLHRRRAQMRRAWDGRGPALLRLRRLLGRFAAPVRSA